MTIQSTSGCFFSVFWHQRSYAFLPTPKNPLFFIPKHLISSHTQKTHLGNIFSFLEWMVIDTKKFLILRGPSNTFTQCKILAKTFKILFFLQIFFSCFAIFFRNFIFWTFLMRYLIWSCRCFPSKTVFRFQPENGERIK